MQRSAATPIGAAILLVLVIPGAYADDTVESMSKVIANLENLRNEILTERFFDDTYEDPKTAVVETVKSAIELYESTKAHQATVSDTEYFVRHTNPYAPGTVAFNAINSLRSNAEVYPFVMEVATTKVVAEGAFPVAVGLPAIFLNEADRPLEDILEDLNGSDGTWVTYTYNNPGTGSYQDKHAWLSLHDGYIFGAGYYSLPDDAALDGVNAMVRQYDTNGEESFADIPVASGMSFVLDAETLDIVAHTDSDWSGSDIKDAIDTSWSHESVLRILDSHGSLWLSYPSIYPQSGGEYVRAHLQMHDDYIFASGHEITLESRIQSLVDEAVQLYDLEGDVTFGLITSRAGAHQIVLDQYGTIQANSKLPGTVGINLGNKLFDQDLDTVLQYLDDHAGLWVDVITADSVPGSELRLSAWMVLHDGYIFGATRDYSPEDAAVGTVGTAMELYKTHGEEAFDRINWQSVRPEIIYPFVVDAETWETVAHATVPGRVGACCSHAIAESNDLDDIRTQLERHSGVWVEYTFNNPISERDEYKRVWLAMHDGYIFGSGYYYGNFEQAQSTIDEAINTYDTLGKDDAFESISAMAAPGLDYPYVMDRETLDIVAHAQRSDLVGTAFADNITGWLTAADDIRSNLVNDGDTMLGIYGLADSRPGTPPLKVALFQLHDGYIFAAEQSHVAYTR